jgi:PilZ domain-containing protein
MKSRPTKPAIPPQVKLSVEQWREAVRDSMSCRVTYMCEVDGVTHLAEGWMADMSKTGCGIRGSFLPRIGSDTTLTLHLLDRKPPLSFDGSVTWTAGEFFGVSIRELNERDYTRIRRCLWKLHYLNMTVW